MMQTQTLVATAAYRQSPRGGGRWIGMIVAGERIVWDCHHKHETARAAVRCAMHEIEDREAE